MEAEARKVTCGICGIAFEPEWSEEEANAEFAANFPGYSVDDSDALCAACDEEFWKWAKDRYGYQRVYPRGNR